MASLKPLWLSVGSLSERLRRTDSLYLGLDFDGTLTPLTADPRETVLPGRTLDVLRRLARHRGINVAILSSRSLGDLWPRVAIEGVFYAGCSGLETRDGEGCRETHSGSTSALPAPLMTELVDWCRRFPGAWLEMRVSSCALHFSALPVSLQPAFGAGLRRRIRPHLPKVSLVHGRTEFEVMPAGGWDKAAALGRWLEPAPTGAVLLYLGDDTRDEPVHAAVRDRGGLAVAVGRVVSRAEYVLPSADEVLWFLEWLEREWPQRTTPVLGMPGQLEATTA